MTRPKLKLVVDDSKAEDVAVEEHPLHIKYRPQAFSQVIGQGQVVRAIESQLDGDNCPHAFLFTGPSGVGKTTLARILANHFGISGHGLLEIDGATYSKVEDIRRVTETLIYANFGANRKRMLIIDEAHALSRQSWQALLKPIEEAQLGVYWCLCTTELNKVPVTVQTRCACYALKPVRSVELYDLLEAISDLENLNVDPDVIQALAQKAAGSPRMALQYLGMAKRCKTRAEALELIEKQADAVPALDLVRLIVKRKGFTWQRAVKLIRSLEEDESAESCRLTMVNYCAKVLEGTDNAETAVWLLKVLDAFSKPFYLQEKRAPLLLAVGTLCFDNDEE